MDPSGESRPPSSEGAAPLRSDVPSATRMYNYYLGGRDNYAADRDAVEGLLVTHPQAVEVVRNNRNFLSRAVWFMAEAGVDQFIDVGAGIPTEPFVHDLARAHQPDARVVYVDNDPVVLTHARALLAADAGVGVVGADMHEPEAILDAAVTRDLIDFSRPVGLVFVAVLEFSPGDEPFRILRAFRDRLAPGSFLTASHLSTEGIEAHDVAAVKAAYSTTPSGIEMRDRAYVTALFEGFDVVEPGLVRVEQWRGFARATYGTFVGGVGRLAPAGGSPAP